MRRFVVVVLLAIACVTLLASCTEASDTVSKRQYDNLYAHLSNMWAQALSHADAQVAFYGDSRVVGASWNDAYPDAKVVNLGVGGDKVKDLITRLPLLDNLNCLSTVVLAIGGNDCLSNSFDLRVFESQYDSLLASLKQKGLTVYVNTVAGICIGTAISNQKSIAAANDKIHKANAVIITLAAKYGMTVIDMAQVMDNADFSLKAEYASDGVHFNENGNNVWYKTLRPYIPSATL